MKNVHLKCTRIWHVQSDDLDIDAKMAPTLANVWMKPFEASLQKAVISENITNSDQKLELQRL